jgi:[histone H3]-lysine36 N-dimethyltransferase SETMAR
LEEVYGTNALPYSTVTRWIRDFKLGRESVQDETPGSCPVTVTTEETICAVRRVVMQDRRRSLGEIAQLVGISSERVHFILHENLGLSKVCARWVPRLLTNEQKEFRALLSLNLYHRFVEDEDEFRCRLVTGDETWVYYYDPPTKQHDMQWIQKGKSPPKKARVVKTARKVMLSLFWDASRPLLADFLSPKTTINGDYYAMLLSKLRDAIKEKRRGKLKKGVLLLHDNAPPHKARVAQGALRQCKFEELQHPPYSPDLAPSDFHVFRQLKSDFKGRRFSDHDEVIMAVDSGCKTCLWTSGVRVLISVRPGG